MFAILTHQPFDLAQIDGSHCASLGEADIIEPELTFAVAIFDMHVRRFVAFVGVEMEPVRSDAKDDTKL
jgi:hypothetical protein